jgi:hypothetical protein
VLQRSGSLTHTLKVQLGPVRSRSSTSRLAAVLALSPDCRHTPPVLPLQPQQTHILVLLLHHHVLPNSTPHMAVPASHVSITTTEALGMAQQRNDGCVLAAACADADWFDAASDAGWSVHDQELTAGPLMPDPPLYFQGEQRVCSVCLCRQSQQKQQQAAGASVARALQVCT